MKILLGISHPKHVHMFKNFYHEAMEQGHEFEVVVNEKEITGRLLEACGIPFQEIGKNQDDFKRKLLQLPGLILQTYRIARKFQPDIFVGQALPNLAFTSRLVCRPFVIFEDTEQSSRMHKVVMPFSDAVITPSCFQNDFGDKQININGYSEIAYLHPNYFKPDPEILKILGVEPGEKFVIMRFVSHGAHHDVGLKGISPENKLRAAEAFSEYAKVFISSEPKLPPQLEPYRIQIPVEYVQHSLYYASLFYGESATMASESAVLGTPAIFVDKNGRGYTDEEETKYGLVFNFSETPSEQIRSIEKGTALLSESDTRDDWREKSRKMLSDFIDVTKFMVWFVTRFPESHSVMKKDPEYQFKFT